MIRTIRPLESPDPGLERVAKANGFSLHAGVSCEGHQKDKRERLCRYIARPAVAVPRLSLSSTGKVVYTLKTPYRDGTTQVAFEPVDFIARLAALVPKPRINLTRYHGVLAPNHRWRGLVTPAKCGKALKMGANAEVKTPAECHAAMSWAQRLKCVFDIHVEVCGRCGGSVRVVACIEDQDIIDRILAHLRKKEQGTPTRHLLAPPTRAPPANRSLFAGSESTNPNLQGRTEKHVAQTVAYYYSGMSGYEWHAQHSEQGFGINERELLQISNPSRQNQRECLLSTGPLSFLYFGLIYITLVCFLLELGALGSIAAYCSAFKHFSAWCSLRLSKLAKVPYSRRCWD